MKITQVFVCFLGIALGQVQAFGADAPQAADPELFYAVDRPYKETAKIEFKLSGGYDISNPYLNVYGLQLSALWMFQPWFSAGLEGGLYTSNKRSSTETLENELKRHGYKLSAAAPNYSVVSVFRVTPISGMVNLFSSKIMVADISFLLRGGAMNYEALGTGPLIGGGVEVSLGITPSFGIHTGINWDWERPNAEGWQSRVGFRVGPNVRF